MLTIQNTFKIQDNRLYEIVDIVDDQEYKDQQQIIEVIAKLSVVGEVINIVNGLGGELNPYEINNIDDFYIYSEKYTIPISSIQITTCGTIFAFRKDCILC